MKILLLNDYGGATGGAELQMLTLRRLLRDRGHDARLLASDAVVVEGSPNLADYTCYGTTTRAQVVSQALNVSAYRVLQQVLGQFQPDVVHVRMFLWQLSPLIMPLLEAYPSLYQTAVYKAICPAGTNILPGGQSCQFAPGVVCLKQGCLTPQSWLVSMGQRQLWLRWAGVFDRVVALSHGMRESLERGGMKSVEVVYNGVPERAPRAPLQSPPMVGYAGRFSPEKGVDTLLLAFAEVARQVPQARLLMAGQGAAEADLRRLAERLKIASHIHWLGHLSRAELEKQFETVWVQVVPSVWAEPFGNVTTEAMMRGTAVVASAVGAQPEIIGDDSAGALVPPGDVAALSAAILPILKQKSIAEQMGKAGRRRAVAHFSETTCVERFIDLYCDLAGKPALASRAS